MSGEFREVPEEARNFQFPEENESGSDGDFAGKTPESNFKLNSRNQVGKEGNPENQWPTEEQLRDAGALEKKDGNNS